ncbi:hypothetical protein [Bacillus kexueae]|uniref:hypothetical protein n=1 Tax=Aeribacillus kexueae TaxID=2078952 RepID=UPI001FAE9486|nr:hypothetical protein [Bacillus kexueae]
MNMENINRYINNVIKVNRGGPESRSGSLLFVASDYLVLLTNEDGVVYYNLTHVKSVTADSMQQELEDLEQLTEPLDFEQILNFNMLLENMKYRFVRINRGGPEKVEGVLTEMNDGVATLISNNEIINVSVFHIKNISLVDESKEEKKEEAKEENDSKE